MLFIMGFASLVVAVCGLWPNAVTDSIASQMGHASWDGFTHHDTIFPLFLFIAGVSFPFSLSKQRSLGLSTGTIYAKIVRRALTLVLLGVVYNGLFRLDFENLRIASVLGRIGLAWGIAAVLYLNFGVKARIAIAAAILVGYGLLSALVAAPDVAGAGPLTREGCLAGYVDRLLLPGKLYGKTFDPEGLLSTVPAVVTAMLGMFTGGIRAAAGLVGRPQGVVDDCGGRGAAGRRAGFQRGGTCEQIAVVEYVRMCRGCLFAGDVRPVLLPDRRQGMAPLDALLPRRGTQFDHDLSGPAYRGLRAHIRFLPRGRGVEMPGGACRRGRQCRLCGRLLAVSLFPLQKESLSEGVACGFRQVLRAGAAGAEFASRPTDCIIKNHCYE